MRARRLFLALVLGITCSLSSGGTVNAIDGLIGDEHLTDTQTQAPAAWGAVPDNNQYKYHKDELALFVHFSINTFTGVEWGNQIGCRDQDRDRFTLQSFDAETLVRTAKEAGFKKVIVTAKHHDGFCIWRSAHTEHDVESTVYKGDVLEEISKACTNHNMDMGLYLSPWDANNKSYGYYDKDGKPLCDNKGNPKTGLDWNQVEELDVHDYNEYYNNQLIEILGNSKYGNNGRFVEVWMDGAKGSGASAQNYNFTKWFDTIQQYEGKKAGFDADCMLFGAGAYTTVHWIGNESGIAHSNTWAKVKADKEKGTLDTKLSNHYAQGYEDGNQWSVPESDARITSGWFWGENKKTPKTVEELANMYFNSVGHNSPLLLNVPPNNQGTTDEAILNRLVEFGQNIKDTFKNNMAQAEGVKAYADSVLGSDLTYKPGNVLDNSDDTYWTTQEGQNRGTLVVDLGENKKFDVVSIEETIRLGQRIKEYKIEVLVDGEWKQVDSGTTIGAKRLARFPAVTANKVRITVATTDSQPLISSVGVFKATKDFEAKTSIPEGFINIDNKDTDINDGFGFTYEGWSQETGIQYTNGTNMWKNAGDLTLTFTGTKVYLLGTVDPKHGTADIYIDDQLVTTINTNKNPRQVGQIIFESDDLENKQHVLRLDGKDQAIGIEAAAVLNNGAKGSIEIEAAQYDVPEEAMNPVKLVRKGGTEGEVSVKISANPGSAVQGDFNADYAETVTFKSGEREKTVLVETKRNENKTGTKYFTVELSEVKGGAAMGFKKVAQINILDTESQTTPPVTPTEDTYSTENPFVFPVTENETVVLEAERSKLTNTGDANEQWKLEIKDNADWASQNKFVNSLNANDYIEIPYKAEAAGTYEVKVFFRSGDPNNKLVWSDEGGNITEGEKAAGSSDSNTTKTETFDLIIINPGEGVWKFTGPASKSPQLDKFEITLKEKTEAEVPTPPQETEINLQELENALAIQTEAKEEYVEASFAVYEKALLQANNVKENPSSQEDVDKAAAALKASIDNLRKLAKEEEGEVSQETEPINLISSKVAEVSGTYDGTVEGLTDGTEDVKWSSNVIKGEDAEGNAEAWVKYDLGTEKEYEVTQVVVKYFNLMFPTQYVLETSEDGELWNVVKELSKEVSRSGNPVDTIDLETPITQRYIRLRFTAMNTEAVGNGIGIREIEAYGKEVVIPQVEEYDYAPLEAELAKEVLNAEEYEEDSYAVYEAALTQANLLMTEKNAESQEAVTKVSNLLAQSSTNMRRKSLSPEDGNSNQNPGEDVNQESGGNDNQGQGAEGSGNQGQEPGGNDNQGQGAEGSGNQGQEPGGNDNQGQESEGSGNQGQEPGENDNQGQGTEGSVNQGQNPVGNNPSSSAGNQTVSEPTVITKTETVVVTVPAASQSTQKTVTTNNVTNHTTKNTAPVTRVVREVVEVKEEPKVQTEVTVVEEEPVLVVENKVEEEKETAEVLQEEVPLADLQLTQEQDKTFNPVLGIVTGILIGLVGVFGVIMMGKKKED